MRNCTKPALFIGSQAQDGLEAFANVDRQRRTMREFRTAHSTLAREIGEAWQRNPSVGGSLARRRPVACRCKASPLNRW